MVDLPRYFPLVLLLAGVIIVLAHMLTRRRALTTHSVQFGHINHFAGVSRSTGGPERDLHLPDSEARFRAIFEQAAVGIAFVSPDGYWLRVNQKTCDLLGYTGAELAGMTWRDVTHADDLEADEALAKKLLAGEIPTYSLDKRYIHKNGTAVWVNMACSTLREQPGDPTQFGITVIQDITERKKAEEALRLSEERFSKVFHASPIAITISRYEDGQFIDVNESCARLYGYRRDEIIGRTAEALGVRNDPGERDRVMQILDTQGSVRHQQTQFHTRQGEMRHAVFSLEPIDLGGERHLLGMMLDDSERKQMENTLRARETGYRTLMEQASDAIFVADAKANYVDVNTAACYLLGYTREELLTLNIKDVVSPEDLAVRSIPWEAMRAGTVIMQRHLVRKDGTRVPTEVSAKLLEDGRLQVFARDITGRKQAEARDLQSRIEQEKIALLKQFIGDISHDFRTPFSVMGTSIYLLKKSADQDKRLKHLDKLQSQIAHVQNLFEDQLTLLKLDMGETEFDFEAVNLDTLIRGLITQQEGLAAHKGHRLVYTPDTGRLRVRVDRALLMTALRRLVLNALHYTPDGGTVDIRTHVHHENVLIEVHDTGIGIEADEIPLVFDRFYRSNKARGMETGGSGLGLTIARKIVEAHGGTVEVESRIGEGSVFRIVLPRG